MAIAKIIEKPMLIKIELIQKIDRLSKPLRKLEPFQSSAFVFI